MQKKYTIPILSPAEEEYFLQFIRSFEFTGTSKCGILNQYRVAGKLRSRVARPLPRERVLSGPEFANTRLHADFLKKAAPLVSCQYKRLPAGWKCREIYRRMMSVGINAVKSGLNDTETDLAIGAALQLMGYRPQEELAQDALPAHLQEWVKIYSPALPAKPAIAKPRNRSCLVVVPLPAKRYGGRQTGIVKQGAHWRLKEERGGGALCGQFTAEKMMGKVQVMGVGRLCCANAITPDFVGPGLQESGLTAYGICERLPRGNIS